MKIDKIHNKGQARLFENKYLEMLTKGHPAIIWGMYLPVIIYMLYRAHEIHHYEWGRISLIFCIAFISWTVFEYFAHRYIFHIKVHSASMQKVAYIMHGNHHHYPRDRQRLFMPPVPSIIIAAVLFGLFYLFMGNYALIFFPGFIFGYLSYASLHYAIHAFAPPFKFMKPLWRNHHLHHYKDEDLGFGVSNTFWDRVFGTMFDLKKEKEDKEKVKEIMFEKRKKS